LEVTKKIRKMIVEKKDADEIARGAVEEGMKTMLDDGLEKVSRGLTTLEEILRVTKAQFV
jgi:type II secretory ATPase GspE/PulE/Tfp pilus assembly ATPase PilB-like protein